MRKLVATARTLDRYRRDEQERSALWPAETLDGDPESIWISEQSAELLSNARRIASNPLPVLITGETGTGKEMLARAIHRASDRAERPLQAFNCSAVPRDMLESQLFGHKRGAFTGADTASPGVIRAAAGGTLFLDEIAEMNLDLQPKLLRFLDYQEVHPLGEPHPIKVDVRVIAATNADLERLVADGRFREDLFYRLNVVRLPHPAAARAARGDPAAGRALPAQGQRRTEEGQPVDHRTKSSNTWCSTTGPATSASSPTRSAAWSRSPTATRPSRRRCSRRRSSPRDGRLPPRATNPRSGSGSISRCRPRSTSWNRRWCAARSNARTGRVEEASRLLGISRKGLFLKRRRWGLREAS